MPHTLGYFSDEVTDRSQHKTWWFLKLNVNPTIKIIWFRCHFFLLSPSVPLSLLTFSLILCCCWLDLCSRPLTLDSETSDQSPLWGRTKLIGALLLNCIRGQLRDSSPQSLPLLYFDPSPPSLLWFPRGQAQLCFSYNPPCVCCVIIQHQPLLIKSMPLRFKWKLRGLIQAFILSRKSWWL